MRQTCFASPRSSPTSDSSFRAGDSAPATSSSSSPIQLWFISAAAIGEGFAIGMANGVELGTLWGAIKESVGDSFVVRHDAPSIFAGHYDTSFTLGLCLKDLGLIQELSRSVAASLPMTEAAVGAFSVAAERYGASAAELHVAKRIEDDASLSMRLEGEWTPPWEM